MTSVRDLTLPAGTEPPDLENGSIFFIGTATVLIRYAGFTILTDPNFIHMHEEVDLGYGIHAERLTNPAINLADLPPVDFVLLSHFHGDHFDQLVQRELDKTLPIVTCPEAAEQLEERGFQSLYPLQTWESLAVAKGQASILLTSMPGRHGPPGASLVLPEVMGTMLQFQSGAGDTLLQMYITGDTLVMDDIKEIPRRYPDIDLALLHLGGTKIMGLLLTMDAEQGVEMMQIVQPDLAIPIHYNDYEVFKSPLSEFQRAVEEAGLQNRVHYLNHGETYSFTV
jgi:L-ascorbate metabolism protein UlaG (beta-lactamase superfamily)